MPHRDTQSPEALATIPAAARYHRVEERAVRELLRRASGRE